MDGYHEIRADGSLTGMDVEYLEALCDYVSWNVEYVKCGSWDDALDMLRERKIDLVGSAQYSKERAEMYQYASLASCHSCISVREWTRASISPASRASCKAAVSSYSRTLGAKIP